MQATYEWKLFFFFSKICLLLAMGCLTARARENMKDTWRQFHLSKKENQSKHFLAHIPSIDPNATLVVEYEVRTRGVLQTGTIWHGNSSHLVLVI